MGRDFTCTRCREHFGFGARCRHCGVGRTRTVKRRPSRGTIGGKRGRNSGRVRTNKS